VSRLALAKQRAAARRRQDGAAMFVVAMTVAVLASVGVYALAAAANEVRTSGNERQNTQTHYMAQYGIIGSSQLLTGSVADQIKKIMKDPTQRDTVCLSLAGVPATDLVDKNRWCYRLEPDTFQGQWNQGTTITDPYTVSPYAPNVKPGSFGTTPMNAFFFVEVTEPIQLKPAGYSDRCASMVTVTSYGHTQPVFPGATDAVTAQYGGESIEVQRARLLMQPVACGQ
jgi:hypothetical protein